MRITPTTSVQYCGCYWRPSTAERPAQAIPIVRIGSDEGSIDFYPDPVFRPIPADSAEATLLHQDGYGWHAVDCACFHCHSAAIGDIHQRWQPIRRWRELRQG